MESAVYEILRIARRLLRRATLGTSIRHDVYTSVCGKVLGGELQKIFNEERVPCARVVIAFFFRYCARTRFEWFARVQGDLVLKR